MAKRKSGRAVWILLILAISAAALYWYHGGKLSTDRSAVPPGQGRFVLERSGAGSTADFTASSRKIHTSVDTALAEGKGRIYHQQEQKRDVPRQQVEGSIRWHARALLVSLPDDMKQDTFRAILSKNLQGAGEVLSSSADEYQGYKVTRFDVGFRDKLEGDDVTIITDRLYLMNSKNMEGKAKGVVKERGRLAIIIDDFGYTGEPIGLFTSIDRPLTFAVLPYQSHTQEAAARGLAAGHQIILHLPLEPLSGAERQEKTTIRTAMSDDDIKLVVVKALDNVPGAIGVNNHQGSKATSDKRVMRNVLAVVKNQGLFFIDSRTTSQSVAGDTARDMKIRNFDNEIFLDHSSDVSSIKQQIRAAGRLAAKEGSAVVIGHARPNTAMALRELIPELEADGIRLVFASQLVK